VTATNGIPLPFQAASRSRDRDMLRLPQPVFSLPSLTPVNSFYWNQLELQIDSSCGAAGAGHAQAEGCSYEGRTDGLLPFARCGAPVLSVLDANAMEVTRARRSRAGQDATR
jgi:hypothetical protein